MRYCSGCDTSTIKEYLFLLSTADLLAHQAQALACAISGDKFQIDCDDEELVVARSEVIEEPFRSLLWAEINRRLPR